MHYELTCEQMDNRLPIRLQGQEYPNLSACPDWVDGLIARTAYGYISEAVQNKTSAGLASIHLHQITGQQDAFACYLALALIEAGDEKDLIEYVVTALEDSKLKQKVKNAHASITDQFPLAIYHGFAKKSPETLNRIDSLWPLRKTNTRPLLELSIAFDDEVMAKRLVAEASNKFEYTLSFISFLAQHPFRDSKVRSFLIGCFDDIRSYEIKRRLEMQNLMMGKSTKPYGYSKITLSEAPPYGVYDFKDASLVDLKVFDTPGFDQWLQQDPSALDTLADSLSYSSLGTPEVVVRGVFGYVDQALTLLFESEMPVIQIYMQAFMSYDREKFDLAKQFHTTEQELHRNMLNSLISKLGDKDPLSNRIGKRFVNQLGLLNVLESVEKQEDFLVLAKHFNQNSVLQRLTSQQRDTLMGHDLGL